MADPTLAHPDLYTVVAQRGALNLVNRYRDAVQASRCKQRQEQEGYDVEILPPYSQPKVKPLTADIPHGMTATGRIYTRTKEWEE